jgi:hypothetical protein
MPFTTVPDKATGDIFTEFMWDTYIRDNINYLKPAYGTTLPASPTDGQEAILVDSITNPTYQWRFRYNAGSTSAYKWEFIGGSDVLVLIATQETTTSTGFTDLATVGPSFVVPRAGDYDVWAGLALGNSTADQAAQAGVALGAGTPVNAALAYAPVANALTSVGLSEKQAAVAASTELRMRYALTGTGTAIFRARWMRVRPVRVS